MTYIVDRDLTVAHILAGFVEVVGYLFNRSEAAGRAHHQGQRRAGIAIGHIDDVLGLLDILRHCRLQLTNILFVSPAGNDRLLESSHLRSHLCECLCGDPG